MPKSVSKKEANARARAEAAAALVAPTTVAKIAPVANTALATAHRAEEKGPEEISEASERDVRDDAPHLDDAGGWTAEDDGAENGVAAYGGGGGWGDDAARRGGTEGSLSSADSGGSAPAQVTRMINDMKGALGNFTAKLREYTKDATTDNAAFLKQLTGEDKTKLDPLPVNAQLLVDALEGNNDPMQIAGLPHVFFQNLNDMGFGVENIRVATDAVNMLLATRDATDKGRLIAAIAHAKERPKDAGSSSSNSRIAGGGAGGSEGVQPPPGPATGFFVKYTSVDSDAHSIRSQRQPAVNTPEGLAMLKQILIHTQNGNQTKVAELQDTFARTYGTQGVASHILWSSHISVDGIIHGGGFQFGTSGPAGAGALTVQIGGPAASSKVGEITPLQPNFDRNERLAAAAKMMDQIKEGTIPVAGCEQHGNARICTLSGTTHRAQGARTLLQEQAAYGLIEVMSAIKYYDPLVFPQIKVLQEVYRLALTNPTDYEANKLACAPEFTSALTPEGLILASMPCMNIATNLLAEFGAVVSDQIETRFVAQLTQLAQERAKPGENLQGFHRRLEVKRNELANIPRPRINLAALGFSVNPVNGAPLLVDSPSMVILMTVVHAYVNLPKVLPHSRVREVFTAEVLEDARAATYEPHHLHAAFAQLHVLRIDTTLPIPSATKVEDKQQRQVGAFAAGKTTHNSSSGTPLPRPMKPQERGRPLERPAVGNGETPKRSRSQDKEVVDFYGKSIGLVRKHNALKFLQGLHDECVKIGEALFEVNHSGHVTAPPKLVAPHTWGQYGGKLAVHHPVEAALFAGLMLARDMFRHGSSLSKTGVQHCSDNDPAWTKAAARDLRGDLIPPPKAGKGGKKGKKPSVVAAAAGAAEAPPQGFASFLEDGLGRGEGGN